MINPTQNKKSDDQTYIDKYRVAAILHNSSASLLQNSLR